MVVVAGDDGHEMPMCVMKRDKGCPSLLLPSKCELKIKIYKSKVIGQIFNLIWNKFV